MTKVCLGPVHIASGLFMIRQGLRANGIAADVCVVQPHQFGYPYDKHLQTTEDIASCLMDYDVFHGMFGVNMVHESMKKWQAKGKKFIATFNGCDIRSPAFMQEKNLGTTVCNYCASIGICNHDNKLNNARFVLENADEIFCDLGVWEVLQPLAEKAGRTLIPYPQPIDLSMYPMREGFVPHKGTPEDPYIIVHAPSDRSKKGTAMVVNVIEWLRAEGNNIKLLIAEGSHEQVKQSILQADMAIDQMLVGWYGTFAVECMALGVPTLCYLRETQNYVPYPEGMHTDIHNLDDDIRTTLGSTEKIAMKQREHVLKYHNAIDLCRQWLPFYGVKESVTAPA